MATAAERLAQLKAQTPAQARLASLKAEPTTRTTFGGRGQVPAFTVDVPESAKDISPVRATGGAVLTMADAAAGVANIVPASILAGAAASVFADDNEKAVNVFEKVADTLSVFPLSEGGQKILQGVAEPLMAIERGADDLSFELGRGDPTASTLIKTVLLGGLELFPAAKSVKDTVRAGSELRKRSREIKRIAEERGINLDLKRFSDDLAEAAQRLTPDERAQNAPLLVEQLQAAKQRDLDAKTALFREAEAKRTYVETGSVRDLSDSIFQELVRSGTDFEELPAVLRLLDDMSAIETRFPGVPGARGERPLPISAANLNQLEILRRRTNSTYRKGTPGSVKMGVVRKEIDRFFESEFDKVAIDAGRIARGDAPIFGDASGIQAWKDARTAHTRWKQNFSADKTIAKLIGEEATPEQYSAWLLGASSVNAKKQAALTIRRIKEILGDDSPAIEGIRQDYLFEMYEPLLREEPNFAQFTRNYDTMIRRNPSLVKELRLDKGAMKDMHDFAKVQANLPPSGRVFSRGDIITGVTRMAVGHQIAKAAVRVEFSRRLANAVAGVDAVTPKQIISDIMDIRFDAPMIPKGSVLASEFIAGAAITALSEGE